MMLSKAFCNLIFVGQGKLCRTIDEQRQCLVPCFYSLIICCLRHTFIVLKGSVQHYVDNISGIFHNENMLDELCDIWNTEWVD